MKAKVDSAIKTGQYRPDIETSKPGEIEAVVEIIVKSKEGAVKERRVMKSKSYVRHFLELLMVQMLMIPEQAPMQMQEVSGEIRDVALSCYNFAANAGIGDDGFGLVVGTGNTVPDIDDYALESKIANGMGAGQMQYGNVAFGLPTSSGSVSHFTITRDFANASGATITVNEIGLYVKGSSAMVHEYSQRVYTHPILVIRDVIAGGIDVANGDTLTVNYRQQAIV